MSILSKSDYDYINLAACIRGQANWLGIEHEGIPLEGVVVRIANATPPGSEQADRERAVCDHGCTAVAGLRIVDHKPNTASEQAEAIDRMGPAAGCAYCVGAGGYEDYDGEWRECSCQRADRGCGHPNHGAEDHDCAPFLPDRELCNVCGRDDGRHKMSCRPQNRADADREPSERLMVAPAIQAVRDVLNGLEDWEIQDRALEEIRSAVDDIPDCESATATPHAEHGGPSDAERTAAARAINLAGWTCYGGTDEPGQFDTCEECQRACLVVADAALLAAQGVRRG